MRFLLAFVLSFISVFAIAQAPPMAIGGPQGITVKRALIEDWISIPIMSDTPVAPLIGATWPGRGYIVHVAKLGDTSVWHYTGKRWMKIGGAAEDNYTYLLSGGKIAKNNTLNRFTVGQAIYYINGTRYQSSFTQINGFPKTPNANGRIDIIALSSTGPLIIQGTESPNPITPNLGSTRISLGLAYYAPFDSLANLSGNGLTSVFIKRGVDSIFFTTSDTTIAIRDSVGRPVAGNLIDVSKDTVIFGDTMIKNTVFNTNGYTYRILKSGGDTVLNINPTGNIIIKSRQVGDTTGLFSTNIKGNRIAFIDSIQGNESSEPKMLIQYPLSNPGVSIYPVGTLGGLNTDTRSSLNTISGNGVGLIGAWTHTSLGSHSGGGNVTFYKDRVPAGSYRRNTDGLNLEKNDVVFNLSANGGYYATSVANPSYKGLGGLQISVDSLFETNYRSRIQFLTNDASSATASEKMRLTNNGNLLIGTTTDEGFKLNINGPTRIQNSYLLLSQGTSSVSSINIKGRNTANSISFSGSGSGGNIVIGDDVSRVSFIQQSSDNILIGRSSAPNISGIADNYVNGGSNIVIGRSAAPGFTLNARGNVVIGHYAARLSGTGTFPLGDSSFRFLLTGGSALSVGSESYNLMYGEFLTGQLIVNPTNGVDNPKINNSVQFGINSTTRGFLQPKMTNTERDAIPSPAQGLQLFSTTDSANYVYRGTGGGWQKIANEISGSDTLDFPSTGHGNSADLTITVTGADIGDVVALGIPNASIVANASYIAWVSATNTVTVRFNNYASSGNSDPASGTFKIKVLK